MEQNPEAMGLGGGGGGIGALRLGRGRDALQEEEKFHQSSKYEIKVLKKARDSRNGNRFPRLDDLDLLDFWVFVLDWLTVVGCLELGDLGIKEHRLSDSMTLSIGGGTSRRMLKKKKKSGRG